MTVISPKRRPRKRTILGIVLGTLIVLFGALWALDGWVRGQAADYVTEKVREVLSLDSEQPVSVDIAGFSVIAQLATGSLDQVDVGVDNVTIGELTGGVSLRANGVPLDAAKPVEKVQIEFRVSEDSIRSISQVLSASTIENIELVEPEIQFSSSFSLFAIPFEIGVGVEPYAEGGQIGFTPSSLSLNGTRKTADELRRAFGGIADTLFTSRSVCVARWLPEALTLDEVAVRGDELVITIGADQAILDEAAVRQLGSCRE